MQSAFANKWSHNGKWIGFYKCMCMQTTCRCVLVLLPVCVLVLLPVCWVLLMLMLAAAQHQGGALLSVVWNGVVKSVLPDAFLTWGRSRKNKELIYACCLFSILLLFCEGSVKSFATFVPKRERVTAGCAQWVTTLPVPILHANF